MKNKFYQVIEYETIDKEKVGEKFFKELEAFAQENENLFLGYSRKGVLKSQNFVGVIQTKSGFVLEILPKISNKDDFEKSKKILLKMLKTLKNSPFKYSQKANLKTKNLPLLEIFIEMFLNELDILVKKGIKSDYITRVENQNFLKGKLKIKEQISKNFIHKERFFVEYDEYLPDRIENKIIKTTLKKLYSLSKSSKNQQRIREFLFVFDGINEIKNIKAAFSKIKYDRSMSYYQNSLLWSKLFLLNKSFTPFKGGSSAFALLFDMNLLFESYVGNFLKRRCKNIKLQDKKHHLFEKPEKFLLKPDIVVNDGKIVLDTKWKIINDEKDISQNDLYQMFAYASKYENCKKVYLVYPFIEKVDTNRYITEFHSREDNKKRAVTVRPIFFDLVEDELKVY
ncbi:McrC family protein [Nitrosophilus alvini]|uniref:McrC family protein n=1 Tax=Nitrosophilus alvini TaxID=2714855 RepID=UPI00190B6DD7|nr:McrC family protein [Nitrosophilus alvini]